METTEKQIYTIRLIRKNSVWYDVGSISKGDRVILWDYYEENIGRRSMWKDGWFYGWVTPLDLPEHEDRYYMSGIHLKKWSPDV